ncbi:MAG: ATP synthase F1 subunit gamma [Dehalococcoidales bacterium]|nr:ATP synthase F1 subunit gamma [Dehalococcoidales bacterium]
MPSLRQIRRRIRSVKGTAQITKAMELVAASKMRRAQMAVVAARPYSEKIREVIADLAMQPNLGENGAIHPLLERRANIRRAGVLLITSDRGLAGGLNAAVIRTAMNFMLSQEVPVSTTVVGRKGRDWVLRYGREMRAEFIGLTDRPTYMDIVPVVRVLTEDYLSGYVDRVELVYTRFVTTLTQQPVVQTLLPIEQPTGGRRNAEYIYEPSPKQVLEDLLPRFVEVQVYQALLEAIASEQSARMVAMRNATDNANDIVDQLTLMYNQVRQAAITSELIDIAAGSGISVR